MDNGKRTSGRRRPIIYIGKLFLGRVMERLARVQRILRETFDDDTLTVTPEIGPDNFGEWDSVAHVKIVLAVEEEFGIQFATSDISRITSVAALLSLIERHSGA